MKEQTIELEFDFDDNRPNYIVQHVTTLKDWEEFYEDMTDRGISKDYYCDHDQEWFENKYAEFYRSQATQVTMELMN